jgi:Domain of unknown function (DUF4783)
MGVSLAQSTAMPIEDMTNALRNGSVADIGRYIDGVLPITINNRQNLYSRNQASVVLTDFFEKNNPRELDVKENGNATAGTKFLIGDLSTTAGKYSVYVLFRQKDNKYVLQEIKLNKE